MRRKFKRPLTFLLALLLLFSLTGASVQAEESGNAGTSNQAQTVVMQADGTQKEDDVGETASTEENMQPVMFIPAGVGLMSSWLNLKPVIIPVCIITVVAIFTVMLVSGHVTQYIVKHSKNKDEF